MTTTLAMRQISQAPPRLKARVAGVFYVITIVTGLLAYFPWRGSPLGNISNLIAGAAYLVVTLLLYDLLKPVSGRLSLLAVFFSLEGVAHADGGLFFFGFYCILLGYLIIKSAFFPSALGVLMVLAGVGLLTNTLAILLPLTLAKAVSPFAFGIDGVGEISLALWLLVMGLNAEQWDEQVSAAKMPA